MFTLTVTVAVVAHNPVVGVKVYTVVVLLIAGDQFPVIGVPLFELVGNAGIVVPEQ